MATEDNEVEGLARGLLNAIGEEALGETGGDRWKSGEPLNPPQIDVRPESGSPAPPAPTTEKTPEPAPVEPEWFIPGSYKTKEEAIKGIAETRKWASEGWDRVKAMEPLLQKAPAQPAEPENDPLTELENFGVPSKP
jgi:hypothetical protein